MSLRAPPGRTAALEALSSVLDQPHGLAVLRGEPGAGKSQVAGAWRATAATRGFLCGAARIPPVPEENPLGVLFGALLDALSGYERRSEVMETIGQVPAPGRAHFGALQERLARPQEEAKGQLPFSWNLLELDRVRTLEAVAQVIRRVVEVRPLAILLQGFEVASPVLLEYFAPVLAVAEELPLSLLLTMEECEEGERHLAALEEMAEVKGVRFVPVELGPLDAVFLEESLAQRYPGSSLSGEILERLIRAANGNPGRLSEICLRLEEADILFQSEGAWYLRQDASWPFPEEAEEYRLSPVLELDPPDFDLLEFLAGAGRALPEGLLADREVMDYLGVAERPCRKALGRLEAAGLLETVPGGWSFRDPALMRALRSESERSVRTRDLTVLAEGLGRQPGFHPQGVASLLQRTGAEARAAAAFRAAARRYEEQGAWEAAGRSYRQASELEQSAGVTPALEESIDLYRREGNAWQVAAHLEEAAECYGAALVSAELLDLHNRVAGLLCRRGSCYLALGKLEEALEDFQSALDAAQEMNSMRAQRLAVLGLMRVMRAQGDRDQPMQLRTLVPPAADAVELWLELEDYLVQLGRPGELPARGKLEKSLEGKDLPPLVRGRVLGEMAGELRKQGRYQEALDLAGRAVELTRMVGDGRHLARALEVRAASAGALGVELPEGGASTWTELARLAGRLGELGLQRVACLQAGETAVAEGRMDLAVQLLARGSQLAHQVRDIPGEAHAQNLLGIANLSLNKLYEAQSDFETAGRLSLECGDHLGHARSLLGLGRVYASQRKKERAREALSKARDAFLSQNLDGDAGQCTAFLDALD